MALTKPFFNAIPAFDATSISIIQFNVLGGDAITSFTYQVYENASNAQILPTRTVAVSNDVATESVRTFSFSIEANALQNNYTYKIVVTTANATETSLQSESQIFSCYARPSLYLGYYENSQMNTLVSATIIPSPSFNIYVGFQKNDANSTALFRSGTLTLYGTTQQGDTKELGSWELNSSDVTIGTPSSSPDPFKTVQYFEPNIDSLGAAVNTALYKSYTISAVGQTVDGTSFTTQIGDLKCYYATSAGIFSAANNCANGAVTLSASELPPFYSFEVQYKDANLDSWNTIAGSPNGVEEKPSFTDFNFDFYYCGNNKLYDFRLILYSAVSTISNVYTAQTISHFNKSYICDNNIIYNITAEWGIDSYSRSNQNAVYEPFNSPYPVISKNAKLTYRQGQYTAVLLAPTSTNSLDRYAQVKLKKEFEDWLSNGDAKIIKTLNGDVYLAYVTNAISSSYYAQLANGLASSTFAWVECGDINTDVYKLGLGDMDVNGIVSFANTSWALINEIAASGKAQDVFNVGDEKTIELSTNEEVTLVIMGFNHDDLTSGGKAPITIGMKNLLATQYQMNTSNTNVGGWDASAMRTSTMATLLSLLPNDLQSILKFVDKKALAGNQSTTITTSSDKLWLFSEVEINNTAINIFKDEGTQYDYWKTVKDGTVAADRIKYLSNGTGVALAWWLRSPGMGTTTSFTTFDKNGNRTSSQGSVSIGVCFGFCI